MDFKILGEKPEVVDLWEHRGDVIMVGRLDGVVYSMVWQVDVERLPLRVQREVRHV